MPGFAYGFPEPTPVSPSQRRPVNLNLVPELPAGAEWDRLRDALAERARLLEDANQASRDRVAAKGALDAAPDVDRAAAAERFRAGDRADRGTPVEDQARADHEAAQRNEVAASDAFRAADRDVRHVLAEDRASLAPAATQLAEEADSHVLAAVDVLEDLIVRRFERHRLVALVSGQPLRPPIRGVDGTGDLGRAFAALRKELDPPSRRARVVAVSPGARRQARRDLMDDDG